MAASKWGARGGGIGGVRDEKRQKNANICIQNECDPYDGIHTCRETHEKNQTSKFCFVIHARHVYLLSTAGVVTERMRVAYLNRIATYKSALTN